MKYTLPSVIVAATFGCAALSGPTFAQSATQGEQALHQTGGAQERIAYSRKLRMLSQAPAAAACHMAAGIDAAAAGDLLSSSAGEFEALLNALEFGDVDLFIENAETRRKTIAEIQSVRASWEPIKAAAETILSGTVTDADVQTILSQSTELLAGTESLVTEIVSAYFNPVEMVSADSFMINIADRQRMLLQMISKEACILTTNPSGEVTSETLDGLMNTFSSSLGALRNGLPGTGIRPPPTPDINAGLGDVFAQWNNVKPMLDGVVAGSEVDGEAATNRFQSLNEMAAKMDEVVVMYTIITQ
jgi:hypothetical protein